MKFIKSFLLFVTLAAVSFGASAKTQVSQFPTAKQLLPPFTLSMKGWVISNDGTDIIWIAPWTTTQSDWNQSVATAPDFIKNKPIIPAAQVQADWNQTSTTAKDFIKNKPTIPTLVPQVQVDWNLNSGIGSILNKPTIPPAQIPSDWNQNNPAAKDYIKNKPPVVPQVQANWNETNTTSPAYIQNKPELNTGSSGWGGVNAQTSVYTLQATDKNKFITFNAEDPTKLVIPADLPVEDGFSVEVTQLGNGWIIFEGTNSTVKIIAPNEANRTDAMGATAKLKKVGVNTWLLTGDVASDKVTVPLAKTLVLTASARGGVVPYTYQWKKDGVDIVGGTNVSLAIYNAKPADAGVYLCAVIGAVGGTTLSNPFTLSVLGQ